MNENKVKIVTADPSALGLLGLAMVTLVASSPKTWINIRCIACSSLGNILRGFSSTYGMYT